MKFDIGLCHFSMVQRDPLKYLKNILLSIENNIFQSKAAFVPVSPLMD